MAKKNHKWKTVQENNEIMWSTKIKHRRLIWYVHGQRLPNETPAKSVINYNEQNSFVTKLRESQTTTWLKLFEKDLEEIRKTPRWSY